VSVIVVKIKTVPLHAKQAQNDVKPQLYPYSGRGGWLTPCPICFTSLEGDSLPIVQKTEWASSLVWMIPANLDLTGLQTPDLPTHRESLY